MGSLTPEQMQKLRVKFGLDKSMPEQYVRWIGGIFRGDLGRSIYFDVEVAKLVTERMPVTLHLGVLSLILSSILGISFGVICALRRGT